MPSPITCRLSDVYDTASVVLSKMHLILVSWRSACCQLTMSAQLCLLGWCNYSIFMFVRMSFEQAFCSEPWLLWGRRYVLIMFVRGCCISTKPLLSVVLLCGLDPIFT